MSRSNLFFVAVAACAILAAFWYRQQVFRESPTFLALPHLAFVTGGSGPYWQLTSSGARAAAEKFQCDLNIEMPADDENLAQQMTLLTALDFEKLDGIALSPLDAEGQTLFINRIQQQTNVVTFDSDAPLSARRGHVGTSNYGAGGLCARLTAEAIPGGGKILVLLANLTKDNLIDRKSGYEESINKVVANESAEGPAPILTVIDYLVDKGETVLTKKNIRDTLTNHPDLACIVGMNAQHGPIILDVLKEKNKLGEIKVIAFDEMEATLNGIEAGHIYATIAQDPYNYGFETVRMLCTLCRGGGSEVPIVGGGTVNINAEAINRENLSEFRERLNARISDARKAPAATKTSQ